MLSSICVVLFLAHPISLVEGGYGMKGLQTGVETAILLAVRPSSGRREAPGPDHGPDPHGPDPHDEIHDGGLPANQRPLPAQEEQDRYYKGGPHLPNSLLYESRQSENRKTNPRHGDDDQNANNDQDTNSGLKSLLHTAHSTRSV